MTKVKAAILLEDKKLILDEIDMDEPKDNEVQIKMVASGVCGTDLSFYRNHMKLTLPAVLGHEGGGIIEKVGKNVTRVKPGDKVVIYSGYCGECEECRTGRSNGCSKSMNPFGKNMDGTFRFHYKGEDVGAFLTQGTFKERVIVNQTAVLKVDDEDDLNLYCCFVCGPKTGAGAVLNTAQVQPGDTVVITGLGTVGMCAVMAASRLTACKKLIVCDVNEERLAKAVEFGADAAINGKEQDMKEEIMKLTDGYGANVIIECSGVPAVVETASGCLRYGGKLIIVGDGAPKSFTIPYSCMGKDINVMFNRGPGGNGLAWAPFVDKIIKFNKAGKFPVEKLVKYYKFDEIQTAFDDLAAGEVFKPIVLFDE